MCLPYITYYLVATVAAYTGPPRPLKVPVDGSQRDTGPFDDVSYDHTSADEGDEEGGD